MPRNRIKDDDLDFEIFVDPSCLDEPVEDSELPASTNTDTTAQPPMATDQLPDAVLPDSESAKETSTVTVDDIDVPQEQKVEDVMVDKEEEATPAAQAEDSSAVEEQQDHALAEATEETSHDSSAPEEADSAPSVQDQDQPTAEAEPEHKEEEQEQAGSQPDNDKQETEDVDKVTEDPQPKEQDVSLQEEESPLDDETNQAAPQDEPAEDADAPEADDQDDATDHIVRSVSSQAFTDRKTSLRTEALIQAAARAVVAKLERRKASGDSIQPEDQPEDVEHSILSTATEEGDTLLQYDHEEETPSRRQSTNSTGSQLHHDVLPSGDEGGESSSSHHEPESDDVFSDRSARSSIASFDNNPPPAHEEEEDVTIKARSVQHDGLDQSDRHSVRSTNNTSTRSPRVSGVSMISDLSQYDKEDFVPTSREARLPFRTPSAIRNIQMSSPTPSVIHGVSPRSSKRCQNLPTISRLGSPTVTTTQFSPKGRSTPTRLKTRREAPLVLLHVTVLPLRWMWGDILNCLDALNGKTYGETKETFEASEQLKSLRDSWRELQDHVTDTVLERGVLMPHPQDDFEVLEERFLDSLELPLRRRARILECGHYLGPSNEFGPDEEGFDGQESEDEYAEEKRHWCNTCRNEIKYEDLGPGKVFRVKVYASNGLMRAGAWEACWKEMERVDIEVEPIVEMSVQNELEKLVVINGELEEQRQREMEQAEAEAAAAQAARDEEARLSVLAQSRPQSVAANAMVVQESPSGFNEEQALPASRSLMDTPAQDQQARSSAIISSPGAASMQMMHASPAQPPSTLASMRYASPSSPQPTQSSPLRHAILPPDDQAPEEAHFQQDIYTNTPQPLPLEPAVHPDSMYTHRPTSSMSTSMPMTRHADPYIPPTPRSPSEEAYERRHRRTSSSRGRSTHSHNQKHEYNTSRAPPNLQNASFIELLLEAFKVLLRDPKNVAIIVLCLFLMAILVRPSASSSAQQNGLQLVPRAADMNGHGNEPLGGYRYEAKAVVEPAVQVESAAGSVVVPEAASVLVVTTTVTSTSAEPSVDVEVLVVESEGTFKSESAKEADVMAEETDQDIIANESALEEVDEPVVEVAENVKESLDSLSAATANATVSVLAEEDRVKAEATNQTEASIPLPQELNQELPSLNMTDMADLPEPAEEEEEEASTITTVEELAPMAAQEEVLTGPQNIETDTASTSETETATKETDETVVTISASAAQADATNGTEAKDPCQSIISQKTTLRIIETITETVTVSAVASTLTSSETKVTSEAESESTAEVKSATPTATEEIATVSAPTSVSESVSSMLETTTLAPSPTTVQETVYETETETVRVTVSVSGQTQRYDEP
ncbi:hypothetical protein V8F33_001903 [Rhypophila sp. PSN 637]